MNSTRIIITIIIVTIVITKAAQLRLNASSLRRGQELMSILHTMILGGMDGVGN